ncbi:MAG: hypothetical protein EZS28_011950 [Streblomastix strix]|uniref:RRM domain-containing protein n=1 Tax=Streblomastix strix TaxID=222440 RepID=A0A5J4WDK9_9EUKA|nr:MAG: hypothetical protein EZS28_011950 [Streblomastix strix]
MNIKDQQDDNKQEEVQSHIRIETEQKEPLGIETQQQKAISPPPVPQNPLKPHLRQKSTTSSHSQPKPAIFPKEQYFFSLPNDFKRNNIYFPLNSKEFQRSSNLSRPKSVRYSDLHPEILYDPIIQKLPIIQFDPQILSQIPPDQHKQYIGEFLFAKISAVDKQNALKITGILLELDNVMLMILLRNDQLLIQKVFEAQRLLYDTPDEKERLRIESEYERKRFESEMKKWSQIQKERKIKEVEEQRKQIEQEEEQKRKQIEEQRIKALEEEQKRIKALEEEQKRKLKEEQKRKALEEEQQRIKQQHEEEQRRIKAFEEEQIRKNINKRGLFIRNVAVSANNATILYAFAAFNPIQETVYVKHDYNQMKNGVSCIYFRYDEDALEAFQMMNKQIIEGEEIEIEYQKLDMRYPPPAYIGQRPQVKKIQLRKEDVNQKLLFISNISPQTTQHNLELVLTPFNTTKVCLFKYGQFNRPSYSLVEFQTEEDAIKAFAHLDQFRIDNSIIRLHSIILRVDNLNEDINEVALANFFLNKLPHINIRVILIYNNSNPTKSLGFGYINFNSVNDAQQAVNQLNNARLRPNSNAIKLTQWQPKQQEQKQIIRLGSRQIAPFVPPLFLTNPLTCFPANFPFSTSWKKSDFEQKELLGRGRLGAVSHIGEQI